MIAGEEVEREHCTIKNIDKSVTLTPKDDALCLVNGNIISEPTKLTQGNTAQQHVIVTLTLRGSRKSLTIKKKCFSDAGAL